MSVCPGATTLSSCPCSQPVASSLSKAPGTPNLSRNLSFLLPSPRSQHDCMMPPPAPCSGRGDFQKLYLYMHARGLGPTGCIYTVLDATGWQSRAGVPAAAPPLAERGHDTHSDRGRGGEDKAG